LLADRSRPAQALEVDVQGETASAISMAHDSNWSLPYLEEQIKQHKGDVNAIFHEVCQPCYQKLHPMRNSRKAFFESKTRLHSSGRERIS